VRGAALVVLGIGATGSFALMLRVGQRAPLFLLLAFAIWVLAPFAVLAVASHRADRWSAGARGALYGLMPLVTLTSLAVYGHAVLRPPKSPPAAPFLLVPFAELLATAIVVTTVWFAGKSPRGRS